MSTNIHELSMNYYVIGKPFYNYHKFIELMKNK